MDWTASLATAAIGTAAGFLGGYLHWILKRNYVRDQLIADRRNERRHQAILEALRAVGKVIANMKAGCRGPTFLRPFAAFESPAEADGKTRDEETLETALHALRPRLKQAEWETLMEAANRRADDQVETAHITRLRQFLADLLD
jgi:hypothetical protein